jgi:nuclear transport factor 2 (NTF2) superfamily protein
MSGTMVRKVATRTFPLLIAAQVNLVLPPPSHPLSSHTQSSPPSPPPLQDDDLPVAKRPRLLISTSDKMSKAAVAHEEHLDAQSIVDTETPDDMLVVVPTHASLPNDELDPIAVVSPVQTKKKWTPEEDAILTEAVHQRQGKSWLPIAELLPGRTSRQCRSRWMRQLDPNNSNKGKWTREEDIMLIRAVGKLGTDFIAVAALIPGRTNERCRYRWVRNLNLSTGQELVKGKWSLEEDVKLIEAVQRFGKNWVPVAALVYTRSNSQCRQRWLECLEFE